MSETTWLPGQACRDPETGTVWRCCGVRWVSDTGAVVDGGVTGECHPLLRIGLARALAAGPDLTDELTALRVAHSHRWAVVPTLLRGGEPGWRVQPDGRVSMWREAATVQQAVAEAVQAAKAEGADHA